MISLYKSGFCELNSLQSYQIALEASNYQSNFVQLIAITWVCTPKSRSRKRILIVSAIISSDDGDDETISNSSQFTVSAGNSY